MGTIDRTTADINTLLANVDDTGLVKTGADVIVGGLMYTADGGIAKQYVFQGIAGAIKGELMHPSLTVERAVSTETSEFDAIGVLYTDTAIDGEMVWVVISGAAYIFLEDATATEYGNWVYASSVDGRVNGSLAQPAGGTITALTNHFKEVGHSLDSKVAGTDVLALIHIHFN